MSILKGVDNFDILKSLEKYRDLSSYVLQLLRNSDNKICLIDAVTRQTLNVQTILDRSINLAVKLQSLGCDRRRRTIVAILSENRLDFAIVIFAAIFSGITLTVLNPNHKKDELLHTMNISRPTIVFCSCQQYYKLAKIEIAYVKYVVLFDRLNIRSIPKIKAFVLNLSDMIGDTTIKLKPNNNEPNDTAFILYSSGTTGLAKGVMMSRHKCLYSMISTSIKQTNEEKHAKILLFLPLCHVYGFFVFFASIVAGKTVILMPKFDIRLYLQLIQEYKIKCLHLVPTAINILLKSEHLSKYDVSSVDFVVCGGSTLDRLTEIDLTRKLKLKGVLQAYAMTETGAIIRKEVDNRKIGSSGKIIAGTEIKVIDIHTGKILPAGERGEIYARGPTIMNGYYGDEKATSEIIDEEGWFRTGDIGYYDEDGDFFIVDRCKDLIKYNAYQVPPAELEALLMKHPDVIEAAVVGIPDPIAGEIPKAFITKRPNSDVTERELIDYIAALVSPQKWLRGGVKFVESIPKTVSGKVQKNILKLKNYADSSIVSKY